MMDCFDLKKLTLAVIFVTLALVDSRNLRAVTRSSDNDKGTRTFVRDAVEQRPMQDLFADRKMPYLEEFGSKRLPLRAAVESVPDMLASTRRLPLRDSVEKRPLPSEFFTTPEDDSVSVNSVDFDRTSFNYPYYQQPSFYINVPIPQPQVVPFFYTATSPYGRFQQLISDYRRVTPYRIDNGYQQVLQGFPLRFGRNLRRSKSLGRDISNDLQQDKKVVCYIEGRSAHRKVPLAFSASDVDPYACTHVIYYSAQIDPHSFKILPQDPEYDVVQGGYLSITGLKRDNQDLKAIIAVEADVRRFSALVSSANKRRNFIKSLLSFLRENNFDGVDLSWLNPGDEENGGSDNDKENYVDLIDELSEIFKRHGYTLIVSAPAGRFKAEDGFDIEKISKIVDFVNLHAYRFDKERDDNVIDHHAPLHPREHDTDLDIFNNVDYTVKFWLKHGLPRSKLVLGIPFFGRTFNIDYANKSLASGFGQEGYYTQKPGFLAYFEICDLQQQHKLQPHHDSVGSPFLTYDNQWIGYDDVDSVKAKVRYAKEMELGGVFIRSLDMDDFRGLCGTKYPLLEAVKSGISDIPAYTQEPAMKPYGTCDSDGLYSDRRDCASYFICKSGFSYHLKCGSGYLFDPITGKCDYIDPSKCRPGQTVHIQTLKRNLELILRSGGLRDEEDDKTKVVCYITNWSFYRKGEGKFVPEQLNSELCTHVVYAFASLDPQTLLMKEFDPWADIDNNLYNRITALKDTKVLLSLGGWTDSVGDKYSRLVSDGSARRKFIISTVAFLRRYNFRGLHLDWNYPICWQSNCQKGPASDKSNFVKLVQELRAEFDKQSPRLILAAAISGYKEVIDVAYDLPALGNSLEFMSVMSYDYHGAWERMTGHVSPLTGSDSDKYKQYNTKFTLEYLVSNGAPRKKLLMGVPFYGQSFTLSRLDGNNGIGVPTSGPGEPGEYTKQPGMLAYYEICNRVNRQRWTEISSSGDPYAYFKDQWVSYDNVNSIMTKAQFIKNNGYGGAVAWTADLDDFTNRCCQGAFPLLRSLNIGLGRLTGNIGNTDCTKPTEPVTPPPPTLTTGVDSGASETTTETHHHHETTTRKPITWWTTTTTTSTTTKPTQTNTPWWQPTTTKPTTSTPWWSQSSTTGAPWWATSTTTTTTVPPAIVTMPEIDQPPAKKCDPGQYLPDPNNCNAYYRCILGELTKQYCAGGLHFNKDRNICDWPSSAGCQSQTASDHVAPITTKRPPINIATTKRPFMPVGNKCQNGQYYQHEECGSFYICVNDQLVTQHCASGLHWNHEEMMCDWRYKVRCTQKMKMPDGVESDKYTMKEPSVGHLPYTKCQDGTYSAYAGSCSKYLLCQWGKYVPFECAPGLHWNAEKNFCDWPIGAKCTADQPNGGGNVPDEHETDSAAIIPIDSTPTTTATIPIEPEVPQEPLPDHSGYYKIVCYFTNWAWYRQGIGKYLPEDIDANLCTHIVYGFAVLDYENLVIKAHDSWADFDNKFYERVVAYKQKGLKVTIAIGGWNDSQGDKYSRLVNNPGARARFITNVVEFIQKHNFDGLDLDWEYPKCWQVDCKKGPDSDKPAFAAFVRELKAAFRPKGLLLSAAVSPSKTVIDAGYDVPAMAEALDWVAVMTYDFHGQWDKQTGHVAPLYEHPDDAVSFYNSNYSINYWISEGVPSRKIVMGMPLYGQSFRLEKADNHGLNAPAPGPGEAGEYTRAAGFLAYYEICHKVKHENWNVVKDPKHRMGPYAYKGQQWVSYDDVDTIRRKSEYIKKMNLGGGMIWALDLDDFKNRCGEGKHPLLSTIRRVLSNNGPNEIEQEAVVAEHEEESTDTGLIETPMKPSTPQTDTGVTFNNDYKVVCYFTNWAWYRQGNGKYLPSDIDPDLCTHIIYGFAVLNGDQLIIKPHDTWADFDNKFYEKVTAFKAKGIKVLIAIGGWNDSAGDKYSKLVNNPSSRRRFINHVIEFIKEHNFDGLDLDWEYPKCWQVDCNKGPHSDKENFAKFVEELSAEFKPHGWLLSAAVSPSRRVIEAGYDVPALSKYLDWIAVMAYDYHGQWDKVTGHVAPMYAHDEDVDVTFNTNFTIHYWIEQGADRKKLVLGMPMYGQSFSLADNNENGLNAPTYGGGEAGDQTRARGFLAYYEICQNIQKLGWKVVRDKKGRIGPYAYLRDQWVSFDDRDMIRHKSEYIKAMGLGGGMIWALDLDDFRNLCGCEEYPLLRTINRVLRDYSRPEPKCSLGVSTTSTTVRPVIKPMKTERPVESVTLPPMNVIEVVQPGLPCRGNLFESHETDCAAYYLCDHGVLQLNRCPNGLFWSGTHCDWPENTKCHPDGTTTESQSPTTESWQKPTTVGWQEPSTPSWQEPSTIWWQPSTTTTTKRPVVQKPSKPAYDTGYKVVCYFTNWAWYRQGKGKYLPSDIDADLCTHITYGFATLDYSELIMKPYDSWADIDNEFYTKVVAYQSKGIKVLIALGGWNDSQGDKYSRLANSPSARAKFIRNAVAFIEKYGFDGLDLDWEYPKCWQTECNKGPESDKQGFSDLVRELKQEFEPRGWLLSAAVSPSKTVIDAGYDVPVLSKYFDWIAVMNYDYHGQWDKKTGHVAPLYYYPGDTFDYFNSNYTLNYWIELGADPKKLIMGMPLYGQSFSLENESNHGLNARAPGPGQAGEFTRAAGFLAFYEICEKVKRSSWKVVRDPEGRIGPYAYSGNQWVSYDDISDIKRKSEFLKRLGLGGGMIWALDLDDFRNSCGCGTYPLLRRMNHELRGVPLESNVENCT